MLAILPLILPLIQNVVGKLIPDAGKAAEVQAELQKALMERQGEIDKAIADAAKAQADVNLKEAESPSVFVAGWRPYIGWVCGAGLTYAFLAQPLLAWLAALAGEPVPPILDVATLVTVLMGMLGLGTLRTAEKLQGVERQSLGRPVLKRSR